MTPSAVASRSSTVTVEHGPWRGRRSSVGAEQVSPEWIVGGDDFLYLPKDRSWKRRGGTTIQFDTFGNLAGLLPAKWGGKCRDMHEFSESLFSDDTPSLLALVTKETLADTGNLDDGRFGTLYYRDQVNDLNYTLGSEFSATSYPTPGTVQGHKYLPLWYDSGDGGMTRGHVEFSRRFFATGSRRIEKVGNWWYMPNLYGTPARWKPGIASTTTTTALPNSDISTFTDAVGYKNIGEWGCWRNATPVESCYGTGYEHIDDYAEASDPTGCDSIATEAGDAHGYIVRNGTGVSSTYWAYFGLDQTIDPARTWKVVLRARYLYGLALGSGVTITIKVRDSAGDDMVYTLDATAELTASWAEYTLESPVSGATGQTANSLAVGVTIGSVDNYVAIGYVSVTSTAVSGSSSAGYLIPSGPIPPCHAGTLAKGAAIAGTGGLSWHRPDGDTATGSWTATGGGTLYDKIDDPSTLSVAADDTDYIQSPAGGNATAKVTIGNLGFTPDSTDDVQINLRAYRGPLGGVDLTVSLVETTSGNVTRASFAPGLTSTVQNLAYQLTAAEIAAVTNWSNLELWFYAGVAGGGEYIRVTYAALTHNASGVDLGGWKGSDRFYWSVAYVFEDDSVWQATTPRAPNAILPDGLNLFTVDSASPTTGYDSVVYSNLPVPPYGVKRKRIYRTPKIDSTVDDNLQLNPDDLRLVAEIDASVTTYTDYAADDDTLVEDVDGLIRRTDYRMPPPSRYIFAGANRVGHSYGRQSPCAIVLCPVTKTTAYDLNVADDAAVLYTNSSYYVRITTSDAASASLVLTRDTGAALTTTTYTLANETLESLVDKINATVAGGSDGGQWRAQLCPDVSAQVAATYLCPTHRTITSCVVSGQAITKAGGGLSAIPVGAYVTGTGVTAGAYVSEIVSDTELTFVGTITAATKDLGFGSPFGDQPTGTGLYDGYQRVLGNSLPGFLYFRKAYQDLTPTEKSSVWLTVASPGSFQAAANCFSQVVGKHVPPREAGISMGGAAVDNGFVVPFSKKNAAIRNERDSGTGLDTDYHLYVLNESRGCIAWNSVTAGNRFALLFTPEGLTACDLTREIDLSGDIYKRTALTVRGDFDYEAPQCEAAAAMDSDGAYLCARVLRQAIWLTYREDSGHPDRQLCYDFSDGQAMNGLEALLRDDGSLFGWSTELSRTMTVMCEGRRSDGSHLYGWNEENGGSAGDGRIDEFETGDTDNGTAIAGAIQCPWFHGREGNVSGQEIIAWHKTPTGAVCNAKFYRGPTSDAYSLDVTAATSSTYTRDFIMLPITGARANATACYVEWTQTSGGASEVRELHLRALDLPAYR